MKTHNTDSQNNTWRFITAIMAMLALTLTSCDVHEMPDNDFGAEKHNLTLHLRFTTEMPLYQEVEYTHEANVNIITRNGANDVRYTVRAYPSAQYDAADYSNYTEASFMRDALTDALDCDVPMQLTPGDYTIIAWTDYADQNGQWHHDITHLDDIRLATPHQGNTDHRRAYRGQATVSINARTSAYAPLTDTEAEVPMLLPVGKVEFYATDYEEYITKVMRDHGLTRASQDAPLTSPLLTFNVRIHYDAYMPCAFNIFTNKPVDSDTGIYFDSNIATNAATGETSLGFDYILVNGHETTVPMSVEISDAAGTFSVRSKTIQVPIVRGKRTEVRGAFFTASSSSGVGIDPSYSGEYNIHITL